MTSLSQNDVAIQIQHMTSFIRQEANEKVEEIETKADEEFQIEKSRIVQERWLKISEYFNKKEKQIDLEKKIQNSHLKNEANLKILQMRHQHVRSVLEETRGKLAEATKDATRYSQILHNLILQGVMQLLEPCAVVRCRKTDLNLLESVIKAIPEDYKKRTNKNLTVTLDKENFLSEEITGGVEVCSANDKLRVENTLDSRLDQLGRQMLPEIREILFGPNKNRKFYE